MNPRPGKTSASANSFIIRGLLGLIVTLCISGFAYATERNPHSQSEKSERRAKFNYQMFCQGCHGGDGIGHKSVPTLRNSMQRFMHSPQGRAYLVQVPGSAYSVLNDEELTEVLNWMLVEFSDQSDLPPWTPYEVSELSLYRQSPLLETQNTRRELIHSFSAHNSRK